MQVVRVEYEGCFNLGDYSNEKIRLVATIDPDESPEQVIEELRNRAIAKAGVSAQKMWNERYEAQQALRQLERQLKDAEARWVQIQNFLKAQGINPDAPDLPIFAPQIAPALEREDVELIDAD